jgi:hypothetical protein
MKGRVESAVHYIRRNFLPTLGAGEHTVDELAAARWVDQTADPALGGYPLRRNRACPIRRRDFVRFFLADVDFVGFVAHAWNKGGRHDRWPVQEPKPRKVLEAA